MTRVLVRWVRLALPLLLLDGCGAGDAAPAAPSATPTATLAPPTAEERCATGSGEACAEAADAMRVSAPDRATALYVKGCEAGSAYGCARGAALVQPTDPVRAAAMLRAACDSGFDTSCNDLGYAAERGIGVPVDAALAFSLYAMTCDRGAPFGCFNEAIFLETGRSGAAPDEAGAARLYEKACAMGYDHACAAFGRLLWLGEGVPEDRARASGLLRASCTNGYAFACEFLSNHPAP
ncbi:MAG: tetratricopeptide repeat protein [Polyangiaceae bacterium]